MSASRIFITGISSQLMYTFAAQLPAKYFQIFGLTRQFDFQLNDVEVITGDMESIEQHKVLIQSCEYVIHAAAITHSKNSADYYRINYEYSKRLVDLLRPEQKFVFISSRTAVPQSGAYGLSKLKAEAYIKDKLSNYCILQPAEIFGLEKGEGIEKLIRDILDKNRIFYPAVKEPLYPISLKDTVEAFNRFIFDEWNNQSTEVIAGMEAYTYSELIDVIASSANKTIKKIPIPKFALYILKTFLQITKINGPIVPDQVDRLYSKKNGGKEIKIRFSLEEYVRTRL